MTLTEQAHQAITKHFSDTSIPRLLGIDATCGNGNDTLFLAQLGFKSIIGFDVQQQAIDETQKALSNAGIDNVILHHSGHENLTQYIQQPIDCIVFNFGYLPSADKTITTQSTTSIAAVKDALSNLSTTGILSLLCYPGHPAGAEETAIIKDWLETLGASHTINSYDSYSPSSTTPTLFTVTRKTHD